MSAAREMTPPGVGRRDPSISVRPVHGRAEREAFIALPWAIQGSDPQWVPPLRFERRRHLDPRHNPLFAEAEVALWIAWRGNRPVGRISAQVNRSYLDVHHDATGHFGMLEAEDDAGAFAALLDTAEAWLAARSMRRIDGPFSLSINEESGLLVDGRESAPMILMGHAPAYYARHLEALGYARQKDLIAYEMDQEMVVRATGAVAARAFRDPRLHFRTLNRRDFAAEMEIVRDVYNDAWAGNWGFVPISPAAARHMGAEMKPILRDDFFWVAEVDGTPAAIAISLPNINEAINDLDGALLPLGWLKLLWRLKTGRIRSARVALMGVRRGYHNTPIGALLGYGIIDRLCQRHLGAGYARAELSWVLDDNHAVRRMIESFGGRPYKTYRIYGRALG